MMSIFLIFPGSAANVTVCLCEDSSAWKILKLYLFYLVTSKSLMIVSVKTVWNLEGSVASFWFILFYLFFSNILSKGSS